jgi:hypothetical protein
MLRGERTRSRVRCHPEPDVTDLGLGLAPRRWTATDRQAPSTSTSISSQLGCGPLAWRRYVRDVGVVDVAPAPVLAALDRPDQRVPGRLMVSACMAGRRAVAAAHLATGEAHPEMHRARPLAGAASAPEEGRGIDGHPREMAAAAMFERPLEDGSAQRVANCQHGLTEATGWSRARPAPARAHRRARPRTDGWQPARPAPPRRPGRGSWPRPTAGP